MHNLTEPRREMSGASRRINIMVEVCMHRMLLLLRSAKYTPSDIGQSYS